MDNNKLTPLHAKKTYTDLINFCTLNYVADIYQYA